MRWPGSRPSRGTPHRAARAAAAQPGRLTPAIGGAPRGPARDRRGRGVRGPLAWPAVPAMSSRSDRFDDLVLEAIERLGSRVGDRLDGVEFAVQQVPDLAGRAVAQIPVAETFTRPGRLTGRSPRARVVLYRRPLETRARSEEELAELVSTAVVEQVAALLFVDPHDLDDRYDPEG